MCRSTPMVVTLHPEFKLKIAMHVCLLFFCPGSLVQISLILLLVVNEHQTKRKTTPSPGKWSSWGPWQECSKTCGIGIRRRTRTCSYTGTEKHRRCKGKEGQIRNCDTKIACPVHGGWSTWTAWKCTVTCGGGDGAQKRSCTNPKPMFGGRDCEGPAEEKGKCNTQKCPDEIYTLSPLTEQAVKNSIDNEYHNLERKQGETVHIPCSPSAVKRIFEEYPKTALLWTKNGQVLKIDHDRMSLTLSELSIKKLQSHDNGVYVCSVHYAPQVVKPVTIAAVTAVSSSTDVEIPVEEKMSLICHGAQLEKIFKNATQKWLLNGKVYKDFGSGSAMENNVYEVEEVMKNMSGKWTCRIRDSLTNKEWTTNVIIVKVLPAIPRFLRFLSNTNLLIIIGIIIFVSLMVTGTIFGYIITKSREEFMAEFEKWTQVVRWEEIKAGGAPNWAVKDEADMTESLDSETDDEI